MFSNIVRSSVNVINKNNINMRTTSLVLLRCLSSSSLGRQNGVVKWYNPIKGFGFITYKEADKDSDIFVHQSVIKAQGFRSLSDGENVEFDIKEENGKKFAVEVTGIIYTY